MSQPEWREITVGQYDRIYWCKGCGCIKLKRLGREPRYLTPYREKERRITKKQRKK